jgi:phage gp37-like protein
MTTLIEQLQCDINAKLGRDGAQLVKHVEIYGGEFTASEIGKHSTAAPAILITCLGWSPVAAGTRIPRGRSVKFAFFIATKHSNRTLRMQQAIGIAERLCGVLIDWRCAVEIKGGCVSQFSDISAENLYSRASDSSGLGLWLVRASIDVSYCDLTEPLVDFGGSMNDFMATFLAPIVTIESNAVTSVDTPTDEAETNLNQSISINGQTLGAD